MRIALPGYARLDTERGRGIVLESCRQPIEQILANDTIYGFAASQPTARKFEGRAPVYAVSLGESCGDVVVRHSMRGGMFAHLNTDLFLPPTRGLRELLTSLRLRLLGVATPEVIAFIAYPVGVIFRRGDVVTREVKGENFAVALARNASAERRSAVLASAAELVAALCRVGAHHPDLSLRNILFSGGNAPGEAMRAWVLDVDRVRLHVPGDPMVLRANVDRLERSLIKRRELAEISISDEEIAALRASVMERAK